jgi:hypothetical protein
MTAEPPPRRRLPWPFQKLPGGLAGRKKFIIIGGLVAVAVIVGVVLAVTAAQQQGERTTISEFAPDVEFITFEASKQEIRVGESTTLLLNVQNSEDRTIGDARVAVTVEPAAGNSYLSISNSTVELPAMNPDARTGQIKVTITATGNPAEEAVYSIKGAVFAEDARTDVREFRLTIRQ